MGYDVYITRAESPNQSREHPIPEADWKALLASDSSLVVSTTDYYERGAPGRPVERIPMVIWTAHPGRPPFMLIDGAIQIKSPDEPTIEKMVEMARKLNARVVGDEGEVYPLGLPANPQSPPPARSPINTLPLWKVLLAAFLFGCILLGLKLLIFGG